MTVNCFSYVSKESKVAGLFTDFSGGNKKSPAGKSGEEAKRKTIRR